MRVVAINGSHCRGGNTAVLLKKVLEVCEEAKMQCELIEVAEYDVKYCQGHGSSFCRAKGCVYDDGVEKIFEKMVAADAIIIGSPVYMGSVTSKLKALMDRSVILRRKDFQLSGKIGAAVTVGGVQGGGQEYTIAAIHNFCLIHNMTVLSDGIPSSHFGVVGVGKGAGDVKNDVYALEVAQNLGKRVVEELQRRGDVYV